MNGTDFKNSIDLIKAVCKNTPFENGKWEVKHGHIKYDGENLFRVGRFEMYVYAVNSAALRNEQNKILYFFGRKVRKEARSRRTRITNIKTQRFETFNSSYWITTSEDFMNGSLRDIVHYLKSNNNIAYALINDVKSDRSILKSRSLNIDESFEYFTYLPSLKPNIEKYREKIKIGRYIKKIFRDRFNDSEIEEFVNCIKSMNPANDNLVIVKGEDIKYWYLGDRYIEDNNSLGGSCMKGKDCQGYFDIYTKNEDVCQMLILKTGGDKIKGRALLWNFKDGNGNEIKLMDRIYGSDAIITKFKNWAVENEYWFKRYQSYDYEVEWRKTLSGDTIRKVFKIPVTSTNSYSKFPYIDTFKHVYDDFISNSGEFGKCGVAVGTSGELQDDERFVECYHTGDSIDRDDATYCNDIDEYVHVDYAVYCDVDNRYIYIENAVQLCNGNYVAEEYAGVCSYDGEYALNGDIEECSISGETFDTSNIDYVVLDNGELAIREFAENQEN